MNANLGELCNPLSAFSLSAVSGRASTAQRQCLGSAGLGFIHGRSGWACGLLRAARWMRDAIERPLSFPWMELGASSPDGGATSLVPSQNVTVSLPGPLAESCVPAIILRGFWFLVSGLWSLRHSGRRQSWTFPARPGARVFPDPDDGMQRKGLIEFGDCDSVPRSHQRGALLFRVTPL